MQTQDLDTIAAMQKYGGSFVQALGAAARYADERNLDRLKKAFPEYWEKYTNWPQSQEQSQGLPSDLDRGVLG